MLETIAGQIALITTVIGLLPQVIKTYRTKSSGDLSTMMLLNCLLCTLAWLVYGICRKDPVLIWSESFCTIVSLISVLQKFRYS